MWDISDITQEKRPEYLTFGDFSRVSCWLLSLISESKNEKKSKCEKTFSLKLGHKCSLKLGLYVL